MGQARKQKSGRRSRRRSPSRSAGARPRPPSSPTRQQWSRTRKAWAFAGGLAVLAGVTGYSLRDLWDRDNAPDVPVANRPTADAPSGANPSEQSRTTSYVLAAPPITGEMFKEFEELKAALEAEPTYSYIRGAVCGARSFLSPRSDLHACVTGAGLMLDPCLEVADEVVGCAELDSKAAAEGELEWTYYGVHEWLDGLSVPPEEISASDAMDVSFPWAIVLDTGVVCHWAAFDPDTTASEPVYHCNQVLSYASSLDILRGKPSPSLSFGIPTMGNRAVRLTGGSQWTVFYAETDSSAMSQHNIRAVFY